MDTASLLSSNEHNSRRPSNRRAVTISVLLLLAVAAIVACTIPFIPSHFFSSSFLSSPHETARPLTKLTHPVVILISSDGFRFGYQFKTKTPNINRLIKNGTEAETGLIPVFPSLTFPNHNSIATGLYPAHHGIVNNYFVDPQTGDKFSKSSIDPKWWRGEPLWVTVANHGLPAAGVFWPGIGVHKGSWTCPPKFCIPLNDHTSYEEEVDKVLSFFDSPPEDIPHFMALYFDEPDFQGHKMGPDSPQIAEAVGRVDSMIGRLIQGLEKKKVFEDVHIILVSDHGMVGLCVDRTVFLDDLAPWVNISSKWVENYYPVLAFRPPTGTDMADVVAKMNEGLESGKVKNGKFLKMYLKEDLPKRYNYVDNERITPIIGIVEEGYKVEQNKMTARHQCGGAHGYDNELFSMRAIFTGHGPRFARGKKVPSFKNLEIYNLVTSILNIQGAPNNGTKSFPENVLLSTS